MVGLRTFPETIAETYFPKRAQTSGGHAAVAILIGANRLRSEAMSTDIVLVYGSHHRIVQSVHRVDVNVIEDRKVELVASLSVDPTIPASASLMATTVAIHMDQSVAKELYSRLRGTFQAMDWPLPQ
jgi:hypothetical protein